MLSDVSALRRFHVETELARGGMGAVYCVVDQASGRRMALKRLSPAAPARAAALFEHEFYVLSSLKHPRIIEVYEYGIDGDGPYYTMELLEGSDLRELSPMDAHKACRYLRDVASSLALLHARRLLHRDVSPRNVRTSTDGSCKLIDFGALASFGTSDDIVGTPPSIAPEALAGQTLDQRTDLYALGSLAYFLLTGRHAYAARSVSALPDAWATQLAPPSQLVPGIPKELDALVLSLLSLEMLGRPSGAAEVIDRLNAIAGLAPEHDEQVARSYFVGTQLVEREYELERARRRLSRARKGRGSVVLIEGAAGVGKTRLLTDITLRAQLSGLTTFRVDAALHGEPLEVARALVQQALRLLPRTTRAVLTPIETALMRAWPIELPELEAAPEPCTEEVRKQAAGALPGLLEPCFVELSRRHPLLIAVDNVEDADPPSASLLLSLSRHCRREHMLLVLSAELSQRARSAAVRGMAEGATRIGLSALSERGTLELVRAAFGDVPHVKRTAKRLYDATDGHPQHCMQLLTQWVSDGLIRYVSGSFSLPMEIPQSQLVPFERVAQERLSHCAPQALWLAHALSLMSEPVAFETCVAFAQSHLPERQVYGAIDELLRAEILTQGAHGLRFGSTLLRNAAQASLQGDERKAMSLRIGEYLLARSDGSFVQHATAAHHILHGGEELRGADMIAKAARAELALEEPAPRLALAYTAVEAALLAYRAHGRGRLEQLPLLMTLVLGGSEISYACGMRYADVTAAALEGALGLRALREHSATPDLTAVLTALGAAPVLEPGEQKSESTPDVVTLIGWLVRAVLTTCNLVSVAIDHEAEARCVQPLRPFVVFGPTHPVALLYDYCNLMIGMTQDRFSVVHAGWSAMVARLDQDATLPAGVRLTLRMGALYSMGILECQRDDKRALLRFDELERGGQDLARTRGLDPSYGHFMLDQLRVLYHGFRGEIAEAERYRDAVEAYAVQQGATWKAEVWSTCTMSAVYGNTRDSEGNKRVVEHLERLQREMPSLTEYYERSLGTQAMVNGAAARAAALYEQTLARSGPRERVGWAQVRGGLAFAYNELGEHARAQQLCEETLAASADDHEYAAKLLTVEIQLCKARAAQGQWAAAQAELDALFSRYRESDNAVTQGALHRTAAELAQLKGDVLAFEHHLSEMQRWHGPTKNPALIAQYERIRNEAAGAAPGAAVSGDIQSTFTTAEAPGATFLTTLRTAAERRQRALELVAAQSAAREAYLFTRGTDDEPVLLCQLGAGQTPEASLLDAVRGMFEDIPDDSEDTADIPLSDITAATQSVQRHRLLPLTVEHEQKRMLIGAIAVAGGSANRPVSHALLHDLAVALFRSGDMISARTLG